MLTKRFEEAVAYAAAVHAGDVRKGTEGSSAAPGAGTAGAPAPGAGVPYLAHLLAVAALVLEGGGDETAALGALLHDAAEDGGGAPRLADIERRFGPDVAAIVEACSDSLAEDSAQKAPWWERKRAYLAKLPEEPAAALLVSLADKLHNARAILLDLRTPGIGHAVWERFKPESDQLWYYRSLVDAFRTCSASRLVDELDRVVTAIEQECQAQRHPWARSYRVWPSRLYAGAYPGASPPASPPGEAQAKLDALLAAGVTLFLDLTQEGENSLAPYAHLLDGRARHTRLAVRDVSCPPPQRMREILAAIDAELAGGGTVYVHCYGGHGRTGTVVGCHLVEQGVTAADALQRVAFWRRGTPDEQRRSPETDEQCRFVEAWQPRR